MVPHAFQTRWASLSHLSITHCTLSLQQRTVSHDRERLKEQSSCDWRKEWNSTLNRQQEQYRMVCLKHHSWTDCTNWHVRSKLLCNSKFLAFNRWLLYNCHHLFSSVIIHPVYFTHTYHLSNSSNHFI